MELTLDLKTWRCGGAQAGVGTTRLGEGETMLLNEEGYSCCLGQFGLQFGAPEAALLYVNEPAVVNTDVFVYPAVFLNNGSLTRKCIDINDTPFIPIQQRIDRLRKLLDVHGYTLKIIGGDNGTYS